MTDWEQRQKQLDMWTLENENFYWMYFSSPSLITAFENGYSIVVAIIIIIISNTYMNNVSNLSYKELLQKDGSVSILCKNIQ